LTPFFRPQRRLPSTKLFSLVVSIPKPMAAGPAQKRILLFWGQDEDQIHTTGLSVVGFAGGQSAVARLGHNQRRLQSEGNSAGDGFGADLQCAATWYQYADSGWT